MDSKAERLRKIIDIVKRGKKPTDKMVFFPGLDDLYIFQGTKYTYNQLQKVVEGYENPDMPIVIWHEERTYQ